MDAQNIFQFADLLLDHMINKKLLEEGLRAEVRSAIVAQHSFQHAKRRRQSTPDGDGAAMFRRLSMKRTLSEIGRSLSVKRDSHGSMARMRNPNSQPNLEMMNGDLVESPSSTRLNQQFMRKIPEGSEAANILIGEMENLRYQVFREVAYRARSRQDILAGVDEFLDQVTALPPGEWDPKIRIEPPQSVPSQDQRKAPPPAAGEEKEEEEEESHCDPTLQRTGRLFGGLVSDIKRKLPWYPSDFKDGLHIQCVASVIFLYLATLTPNVTFGGLLGQATDQYMGTMECIFTASVVGVLFALFAGQPLNILGSTGPMLVLEMILYNFCKENHLDFLPFRAWIGIWTTIFMLLIVAFDLSALVRYITRFTEESFASLIAIIFIAEAFKKLFGILDEAPINTNPGAPLDYDCSCYPPNTTFNDGNITFPNLTDTVTTVTSLLLGDNSTSGEMFNVTDVNTTDLGVNWTSLTKAMCKVKGGVLHGTGCDTPEYKADVFFLSLILFCGTYIIASSLSDAKTSSFFPSVVRQTMSDFSVLIAILLMVGTDAIIGIETPKLTVPVEFKVMFFFCTSYKPFTFNILLNNNNYRRHRICSLHAMTGAGLLTPWSDKNPWWLILAATIPAVLAVILVFMDQQITAVIVNRKENKLVKGSGYHLDMFVLAICILICSLMGLPWYVAATVSALAHIMSLKKESECTAPGERPTFLGVRENRLTALLVGLLSGLSVLFTSVLKFIPMAVLYGVFLYMGVAALKGMQFIDRVLLIFKPAKYQPDYIYLRHVPIKRVHIFTAIQVCCLAVLWVIKSVKSVSIIFPIMVLGTCFVRKAMDYIFTQRELKWLDDIMPDAAKKEKEDKMKLQGLDDEEKENASLLGEEYDRLMEIKVQHERMGEKYGQRVTRRASLDTDRVNISEEMTRTGIWMQLRNNKPELEESNRHHRKRRSEKNNIANANDKAAAFYLQDDEDHDPKA
ncbi:hypothetical protein C0Q70_01716 [Pomacea canaliculata]|uniref:Anion exchange protein n=1 Tax=Pomacea canaliculata TaxID=400727 RepID=A0A2T7Q092_POMCA|nr:hypothetical protein C0Q70_01716 [Pomacea canaliculata]